MGLLAAAVVILLANIKRRIAAERQLLALNSRLEQQVEARTAELRASVLAVQEAQEQMIRSEKLRLLGILSAGMAHELNSPLGAIRSSVRTVIRHLDHVLLKERELLLNLDGDRLAAFRTLRAYLEARGPVEEFHRKRRNRIRGELEGRAIAPEAEIADLLGELKLEPSESILPELLGKEGCVELLEAVHATGLVRSMMDVIDLAADKAANVVAALQSYLTQGNREEPEALDVGAEIEKTLALLRNELDHGVSVSKSFSDVRVLGSSNRLSQVWLHLIRNGAHAMDYRGTLGVSAAAAGEDRVEIRIVDSGHGIPREIQDKVFEPFFSTKAKGEGLGLGLDLCRKIVADHGGAITFTSRPGRTEFVISLPRAL